MCFSHAGFMMPIRNPSKGVLEKLDKLVWSIIERPGIQIKPQMSLMCEWYLRPKGVVR